MWPLLYYVLNVIYSHIIMDLCAIQQNNCEVAYIAAVGRGCIVHGVEST